MKRGLEALGCLSHFIFFRKLCLTVYGREVIMFLVWFLIGLIFGGPVSVLLSANLSFFLSDLIYLDPIVWWFMIAAVEVIVLGVATFSRELARRKESWLGGLFGALVGGSFMWCFLFSTVK